MPISHVYLNDTLFVLSAASSFDWSDVTRTNFQKILYLSAVLSPLAAIDWGYGFINAPYGPYNSSIHQATDALVPQGYARYTNIQWHKDSKIHARYSITEGGLRQVSMIGQLRREKDRLDWISLVLRVLDIYGPPVVVKLAYREPTFARMRSENRSGLINLDEGENRSVHLVESLSKELANKYSVQLDTLVSKLIVYFDYLSSDIGEGVQR